MQTNSKHCRRRARGFDVGITGDFRAGDGGFSFDAGALADLRGREGVAVQALDTPVGGPLPVEALRRFDAIIMKRTPVSAEMLALADLRLTHIARNGVGTDHLDLDACTRAGVLVTNTPESVRRPIASGALALLLDLAHGVSLKTATLRADGWAARFRHVGPGLTGRSLGLVGCGNIGSEILRLAAPWGMEMIVSAPTKTDSEVAALGATRVALGELLRRADFVVLACPLTPETAGMIDAAALAAMKRGSYLINVARGELVDEAALTDALLRSHLAGAALDVFDPEPADAANPLLDMPNVIVTAHNIGLTEESVRLGNTAAADAVAQVAAGRVPRNVVNPAALDHSRIRARLAAAPSPAAAVTPPPCSRAENQGGGKP